MFRRTFWFGAGAAAGVWATAKVNRKLRSLAPDSLARRAAGRAADSGHRLREFALEVRTGMVRREDELRDALGLAADPDRPAPGVTLPPQPGPRTLPPSRPGARPRPTYDTNRNEDH